MRGRITRTWFRWSSVASTDEIAGSFTGFVSLFIPLAFPLELLRNVTQFLFFWQMWGGTQAVFAIRAAEELELKP